MPLVFGKFQPHAILLTWYAGARCRVYWSYATQRNRRRKPWYNEDAILGLRKSPLMNVGNRTKFWDYGYFGGVERY